MRLIDHIARIVFVAVTLAGCSSAAPASTGPAASPTPTPVPSVEIPPDATFVDLFVPDRRTSEFQIDGKTVTSITVKPGVPYAFRISNPGPSDHNFFIGVADDLAAREYTRLAGVQLWSAGERVFVYTFEPGVQIQFACTLAGHYGPMHGDFVIEP